jgi:hypothetical protein
MRRRYRRKRRNSQVVGSTPVSTEFHIHSPGTRVSDPLHLRRSPAEWCCVVDAKCSSGDWSKKFGFHKNKNNKCQVINDRRALLVYPDPQPDANPTKGCIFLYQSDNCSENKDKKHYENVDAFEVEYSRSFTDCVAPLPTMRCKGNGLTV